MIIRILIFSFFSLINLIASEGPAEKKRRIESAQDLIQESIDKIFLIASMNEHKAVINKKITEFINEENAILKYELLVRKLDEEIDLINAIEQQHHIEPEQVEIRNFYLDKIDEIKKKIKQVIKQKEIQACNEFFTQNPNLLNINCTNLVKEYL